MIEEWCATKKCEEKERRLVGQDEEKHKPEGGGYVRVWRSARYRG
jgi:hypothetical protein